MHKSKCEKHHHTSECVISLQTFVFGHLVDVLLKVIKEISAAIREKGSGRDAFGGEVMKMLCDLAYSKGVPDAQEIFASKGANRVIEFSLN